MSCNSDESSYIGYTNQKNIKYSHNGFSRCDDCKVFIPSQSVAEHMELKHKKNQSEFDEYSTVYSLKSRYENIDALVRQPFHKLNSNKSNCSRGSRQSHSPNNWSIGRESIEVNNYGTDSVDKASNPNATDWLDAPTVESNEVKHSQKKLEYPNVASLKKLSREARPSVRMAKSVTAKKTVNGNGMVLKTTSDANLPTKKPSVDASEYSQAKTMTPKKKSVHRSRSQMRPQELPPLIKPPRRELSVEPNSSVIPTIFDMSNLRGQNYEMSDPILECENNADYEHSSRKPMASGMQNIRKNSIQCPLCVMHKNDFEAHLMCKHYHGSNTLDVASGKPSKCHICGNSMPLEHLQAHIERTHGNAANTDKNEDQFIRCNFCSAHMHIDFMPGHLLRKHKLHEGSIGVIWSQYTDEQVCKWFNDGSKIYIKNGAIYIAQDEGDQ